MSAKPRIILVLRNGAFMCAVSDHPVEVLTFDPTCPEDRLYRLTEGRGLQINPSEVAALMKGERVGTINDGFDGPLPTAPGSGRLQ